MFLLTQQREKIVFFLREFGDFTGVKEVAVLVETDMFAANMMLSSFINAA